MSKNPKRRKNSLILFFIFFIFTVNGAMAVEEVLYKGPRPLKKIFESQDKSGQKVSEVGDKKVGYFYDPTGKTDPFKSFLAESEEMQEKKKSKPKTYLETLDLSQLQLIAIIVSEKGNWAMVRDSKGLGHTIKKGVAIGTRNGVVYSITDKKVVIREEYKDFRGRKKIKDVTKKLPALQ